MIAAKYGYGDIVRLLASKEAGMRDYSGQTAMMLFTRKGATASLLSPFEAGFVDRDDRNQTWYAI